jgi:hypothetical protein
MAKKKKKQILMVDLAGVMRLMQWIKVMRGSIVQNCKVFDLITLV